MSETLKAVIVAAGECKRLQPLTDNLPKCFLEVGGQSLIEYSLHTLKSIGIRDIAFVVGFEKEQFPARLGKGYKYIFNPFYRTTNDMVSLRFAKNFIGSSAFVYLHSDLLYHPDMLTGVVDCAAHIVLIVDEKTCDEEAMKVHIGPWSFEKASKDIDIDIAIGEWTGIAKFTSFGWHHYLVEVDKLLAKGQFQAYDTEALNQLAKNVDKPRPRVIGFEGLPFIEIDFPEDLQKAREEVWPQLAALGW